MCRARYQLWQKHYLACQIAPVRHYHPGEADLRHFEFVSIGANRALAVLVGTDGQVENRLLICRWPAIFGADHGRKLYECQISKSQYGGPLRR
ncbi:MAG: hypothetical protein CM15mP46_0370 [Alphaproteobacteria bacterium]|nr:MAG: hypothetical protein CM15mP46_0370 [Alphaproteobacteria bacterium]